MNIIVAVDNNWGIGYKNDLLVRIPNDQRFFREKTTGNVVIMGRKTLESFPEGKPLKNRTNIVITSDKSYKVDGAIVVHSIEEALRKIKNIPIENVFVIGGSSINKDEIIELPVDYKESIDYVLDKALLERERGIIDARFGFKNKFDDDPVPMTFEEIGSKLGVSRDRIHQIVAKALRKMRKPSYAKILNEGLTKVRLDEEVRLTKVKASQKKLAQIMKDLENNIQEISEDKINENYIEDVLKRIPIIDLGLSVRAYNCLYRGGLKTIYDFIILSDEQVSKIRNMGIRTRTEIEEKLNQFLSIKFNMKLDDVRKILSIN